jgi:hypothetical protein
MNTIRNGDRIFLLTIKHLISPSVNLVLGIAGIAGIGCVRCKHQILLHFLDFTKAIIDIFPEDRTVEVPFRPPGGININTDCPIE